MDHSPYLFESRAKDASGDFDDELFFVNAKKNKKNYSCVQHLALSEKKIQINLAKENDSE